MDDPDLEKYRLPWKLHLMKQFYGAEDGKDLDTSDEAAFIRWAKGQQQKEKS